MISTNVYLHFNGNCREAMTFYKDSLGGELQLMTVGESPMGSQVPPQAKNSIMHARLTNGPLVIMASDMMGQETAKAGSNMTLSITCSNTKEADTLFAKLSAGGKVSHPMKQEFFGYYGDLTDRYGFTWMLLYEKPRS